MDCPKKANLDALVQREEEKQQEETRLHPHRLFNAIKTKVDETPRGPMFVETTISDRTFKARLDTGASHLLLSSNVASKLGLKISKGGGTIKVVNFSPTPINGVAHKVDVSIGEWRGPENLTVVTMDDFDAVLGLEFLDKVKAVLVLYTNTMCILEEKACTVPIKREYVIQNALDIVNIQGSLTT